MQTNVLLFIGVIVFSPLYIPVLMSVFGNEREVVSPYVPVVDVARLDALELEAHNVHIFDMLTEQTLYQRGLKESVPLASLTKLMTALIVLEELPFIDHVKVTARDLRVEGDAGLREGTYSTMELLEALLVASSNDAAETLARTYESVTGVSFVARMNERAQEAGWHSFVFNSPSGLDTQGKPSAMGSLLDVAHLHSAVFGAFSQLLHTTTQRSIFLTDMGTNIYNTNKHVERMQGVLSSKTGFTNTAGGNLSIITTYQGRPTVITVTDSTRKGRFDDMQSILDVLIQK